LGALGLGASLTSLNKYCSDTSILKIYFLCSSVDKGIKQYILDLLNDQNYNGAFEFIDFDAQKEFGKYRSLQNDWTTYGRLLMPDLIKENKALYLDTDLIIETDVLDILKTDMQDFAIAAVPTSALLYALEHAFFCDILHLNPTLTVFNAGVLLMNIELWKQNNIKHKLLEIGNTYPNELLSADQALLNAFFAGNFFQLPAKYNVHWYAASIPAAVADDAIFHFVGSPKPWDVFGKYLHSGYARWKEFDVLHWSRHILKTNKKAQLKRTWSIRGSYVKRLLKKA